MAEILSAEAAVEKIKDGDTLALSGSGGGVCEPTCLLKKLGKRYLEEGKPKGITIIHAGGLGDKDTYGTDALAHEGLVRRDIGGHWAMAPGMAELALQEKIEAYNLPQGVISQMYGAVAGHKPGVITKTGLYTFVDPRIEGGKMNRSAREELVELIKLRGEDWLFYPSIPIQAAFIRGTSADTRGNISCEEEAARMDTLHIAQAAHNSGGIVIAQVKYLTEEGTIRAKDVVVPGIYVDYIVIDPEQKQTCITGYDPALAGNTRVPLESLEPLPLNSRKIVARRAAAELASMDNAVINLGVGMPSGIAAVAAEEGWLDRLTFTVEQGIVGGMPVGGIIFGCSYNPDAIMCQADQFNFYDGGGLDCCFLGAAQIDEEGNVNSSKTGHLLSGCGGAINISQNTPKVVFCLTFTAKGFQADIEDEVLKIRQEGTTRKFVSRVDQITFSGKYARENGQQVWYITERAVFRLTEEGMTLIEIAPGIDLQKDILEQMDFVPVISKNLKAMDSALFSSSGGR